MYEEFLVSPEMAFGLVLSFLGVIFGFVKRENIGVAAKAIGSSSTTEKVVAYLASEYADDVAELLKGNKAAYVFDLAKKDEETLKAVCEVSAKADMKGIADVILFYNSKMKDYEFVNEEMPDKYEKILTEKLSKAILNKE